MSDSTGKKDERLPLIGAVLAGGLASACCVGPLLVVVLGLGSASAFVALTPYRPLFAGLTLVLLAWAGWRYWQGRQACVEEGCAPRKSSLLLWSLGGLALLLLLSPLLLPLFLR
jgi:mercuric ion transport protein